MYDTCIYVCRHHHRAPHTQDFTGKIPTACVYKEKYDSNSYYDEDGVYWPLTTTKRKKTLTELDTEREIKRRNMYDHGHRQVYGMILRAAVFILFQNGVDGLRRVNVRSSRFLQTKYNGRWKNFESCYQSVRLFTKTVENPCLNLLSRRSHYFQENKTSDRRRPQNTECSCGRSYRYHVCDKIN